MTKVLTQRPPAINVSPTGPQFLEVTTEEGFTPLLNTSYILAVHEINGTLLEISLYNQPTVRVKANMPSFKKALEFLRQNPNRSSVILRETWDGKSKTPEQELEEAIPDEEATKV